MIVSIGRKNGLPDVLSFLRNVKLLFTYLLTNLIRMVRRLPTSVLSSIDYSFVKTVKSFSQTCRLIYLNVLGRGSGQSSDWQACFKYHFYLSNVFDLIKYNGLYTCNKREVCSRVPEPSERQMCLLHSNEFFSFKDNIRTWLDWRGCPPLMTRFKCLSERLSSLSSVTSGEADITPYPRGTTDGLSLIIIQGHYKYMTFTVPV